MARRRFVWSQEQGKLVEITADYVAPSRQNTDATLWGDRGYDGLKATDGADISSRTKHREYMKKNDLTTADDFKNEWDKAAKDRADYFQGRKGTITKRDIEQAIDQLSRRRK